jgi:hypothetical protein
MTPDQLPSRITNSTMLNPSLQPEIRLIRSLIQDTKARSLSVEENNELCRLMHMQKYNL